jgi:hypothetical protein
MNTSPQPDLAKVKAAVAKYAPKRIDTNPLVSYPPQDSALRKPLKSHGTPCKGFQHPHFLNSDRY